MSEEKHVLFVGVEAPTDNGFRLIVEFTEYSADAIRHRGVGKFLGEVRKEIPEVTMINFEHVQSKLAKVTLRGEKALGDQRANIVFGREVADELDVIVTRIVD